MRKGVGVSVRPPAPLCGAGEREGAGSPIESLRR